MPINPFFPFIIGAGITYTLIILNRMRITKAYPLTQIILKEVGGTMPKPVVTRAKRLKKWFVSKEGYMTPQFQWNMMLSDDFLLSYWKSENNIYPCLLKEREPQKLNLFSKPYPFKKTEPEYTEAIKTPEGTYEEAKIEENDKETRLVSTNYMIAFPKEGIEIEAVIDDNIKDTVVELWKANTERFTWTDWFSKWSPLIGQGIVLIGLFVIFILGIKMFDAYKEAIEHGIKVTIEGQIPAPPITTTAPPQPPGY